MPTAQPGRPLPPRAQSYVHGQLVSYLDRAGREPPVILLHGWGSSARGFAALFHRSRTARRLLAPDLPGFGESPLGRGGWTTSTYADLVRQWGAELGLVEHSLLGHSYGGSISMRLANQTTSRPDRLLLCSASGIRPASAPGPSIRGRTFKALRGVASLLPPPLARSVSERLSQRFGSADYRAASPELRPTLVAAVQEDLSPIAGHISQPTLVVWGAQDQELPLEPHGRRLQQLIPEAELVVFERSGHFPFVDEAQRFALVFDAFMDAEL